MLNGNALIGDYLHHAGVLVRVRIDPDGSMAVSRFKFAGYAALRDPDQAARAGLVVAEDGDGNLTVQAADPGLASDLWAPGTNLLGGPSLRITTPAKLPTTRSYDFLSGRLKFDLGELPWVTPIEQPGEDVEIDWQMLGLLDQAALVVPLLGVVDSLHVTRSVLKPLLLADGDFGGTIRLQTHTLAQVLRLDLFGEQGHPGQDTAYGQFVDRDFVLSTLGLVLRFTLSVPLTAPLAPEMSVGLTGAVLDATVDPWTIDSAGLAMRRKRVIIFEGYGWPAADGDGAFVSPRRDRLYAQMPPGLVDPLGKPTWVHPKIADELMGHNGADWSINDDAQEKDKPGVRVLAPLGLAAPAENTGTWRGLWQVYRNPDVLWEFASHQGLDDTSFAGWYRENRDRLLANQISDQGKAHLVWQSLLREHYNALATAINSIDSCRPFHWLNFRVPWEKFDMQLNPNSAGLFGGNVRPANHYATVARNSEAQRFCAWLGIPIKTKDDLPASFAKFMAAPDETYTATVRATLSYKVTGTGVDADRFRWADYQANANFSNLSFSGQVQAPDPASKIAEALQIFAPHGGDPDADYLWVAVEDVQAAAEARGFKFLLERLAAPYVLKQFRRGSPANLFIVPSAAQSEVRRVTVHSPFSNPAIPPATTSTTVGLADGIPARMWLLTEAIAGEVPEWIIDSQWDDLNARFVPFTGYQVAGDYAPGDFDTLFLAGSTNWGVAVGDSTEADFPFGFGVGYVVKWDTDARWRRQQDGVLRRSRADLVPPGQFFGASVLWQSWISDGIAGGAWSALIPAPTIEHTTTTWSAQGLREALGRIQHGAAVIPLQTSDPADAGAGGNPTS